MEFKIKLNPQLSHPYMVTNNSDDPKAEPMIFDEEFVCKGGKREDKEGFGN